MHQQRKHRHPRGCRDNDGDMPAGRLSYQHCCLTADRPRSKSLALVLCPQECVASEGGPANLSDLAGELCANWDSPRSPARHPLPHHWAGLTPLGIVPSLAPSPAGSVDLSSLSAPTAPSLAPSLQPPTSSRGSGTASLLWYTYLCLQHQVSRAWACLPMSPGHLHQEHPWEAPQTQAHLFKPDSASSIVQPAHHPVKGPQAPTAGQKSESRSDPLPPPDLE